MRERHLPFWLISGISLLIIQERSASWYEDENASASPIFSLFAKSLFFFLIHPSLLCLLSLICDAGFSSGGRILTLGWRKTFPPLLNKLIGDMFEHRPPVKVKANGSRFFMQCRWKSVLQIKLFCNREHKLDEPYRRYLEKGIRKFG